MFMASYYFTDICISCGSLNVTLEHPLFIGGMCQNCKVGNNTPKEVTPSLFLGIGNHHLDVLWTLACIYAPKIEACSDLCHERTFHT